MDGFVKAVQKHQGEYGFDGIITHKQYAEAGRGNVFDEDNGAVPYRLSAGWGLDGLGEEYRDIRTPMCRYVVKLWAAGDKGEDDLILRNAP